MNWLKILEFLFGSKQERDIRKIKPRLNQTNSFAENMRNLSDKQLRDKTAEFKERLAGGQTLDDILPEAFAVFREATHRILGERKMVYDPYYKKEIPFMAHFDVQVLGAIVLHQGKIAEMKTGEGKTQVAAMAAYLNALSGKGVHVITVNDYLAKRDSEWMGKIFTFLGLTVGCLDKTEPGSAERRAAYLCDITYGTNNEFGFDYLRDNMASSLDQCVQRELNYAIIDEVDNILIDEARTPLIISGPVTKSNQEYEELKPRVAKVVNAQLSLINQLVAEAEELMDKEGKEYELGFKLLIVQRGAPKNKRLLKLIKEKGVAKYMKAVETDYLRDRRLHEIDEELYYTIDESGHSAELTEKGRMLIGGSNPDFFVVPNLSEMIGAIDNDASLTVEQKGLKKEEAYRIFAERSERIHCVGQLLRAYSLFERDVDYVVQDGKILIVDEFTGRILHGRRYSEGLHQALEAKENVRVAGENQTLATITFQNFFKMYKKVAGMTGTAATEAAEFHEIYKLDVVTIPTHRPMIRKDYDDEIYRTQREKYNAIVKEISEKYEKGQPCLVGTTSIEKSELLSKLLIRAGIPHQVLNAKHHAKEAAIVAQAGRLKAVTIATNMAGRGTDIVLGGNFEVLANAELLKEGINYDDLTLDDKRKRFSKFLKELSEEHDKVVELGGLHIIGTERHESRRIDNQLRGRAGRQGDPGSSKFFLSLDDDLMRIFGSERMAAILDRLGLKEGEVISHPLVSRSIGNAQKRVEGRNFDIRKHLKEYDDVMDLQRKEIYGMRQIILRSKQPRQIDSAAEAELLDSLKRAKNGSGQILEVISEKIKKRDNLEYEEKVVLLDLIEARKDLTQERKDSLSNLLKDPEWVILSNIDSYLQDLVGRYTAGGKYADQWNLNELYQELQLTCATVYSVEPDRLATLSTESLLDDIWKKVVARYKEKRERFGPTVMRQFACAVALMVIDNLWKDHLYEMDHLKNAVQFRAWGQKNPLFEYQREALSAFRQLRNMIAKEITSMVFRLEAVSVKEDDDRMGLRRSRTEHGSFNIFAHSAEAASAEHKDTAVPLGARVQPRNLVTNRGDVAAKPQPVRVIEHIGRNDPCPCGSGKKYKKCHGKE